MSLCSGVLRLEVEEEAWFVDFPVGGWIHLIGSGPLISGVVARNGWSRVGDRIVGSVSNAWE
jgi:hypothetical protein